MSRWIWRKLNTAGYGVQSPNDFHFVQHVLREKTPYYGYAILDAIAQRYSHALPCYPMTTNRLLLRLTNHVHPTTIIEVGAGTSAWAMTTACPTARCVAIASDDIPTALQDLLAEYPQVEVTKGDEMAIFRQLLHEMNEIGILHVAHTSHYQEVVSIALRHVTDRTLFIIEGIRANKAKTDWWHSLQESSDTGISYDLGTIGLLFFDRSRHKETYWINIKP